MAIESIVGVVELLKISSLFGLVNIRRQLGDPGSANELLIIWWDDNSVGPAALFTSQLSMALSNGLEVRISHQDDSAYISLIEILETSTPL